MRLTKEEQDFLKRFLPIAIEDKKVKVWITLLSLLLYYEAQVPLFVEDKALKQDLHHKSGVDKRNGWYLTWKEVNQIIKGKNDKGFQLSDEAIRKIAAYKEELSDFHTTLERLAPSTHQNKTLNGKSNIRKRHDLERLYAMSMLVSIGLNDYWLRYTSNILPLDYSKEIPIVRYQEAFLVFGMKLLEKARLDDTKIDLSVDTKQLFGYMVGRYVICEPTYDQRQMIDVFELLISRAQYLLKLFTTKDFWQKCQLFSLFHLRSQHAGNTSYCHNCHALISPNSNKGDRFCTARQNRKCWLKRSKSSR